MADCVPVNVWPELLWANGKAVAATIRRENPNVDAVVLLDGTPVTRDFRCNRVRVWVNEQGQVTEVPRIG
ncbi:hypothetical protein SLA2020_197200 [Shorea laevis]